MKKLLLLFVIFMASCTHGAKSGKAQLPMFSSDWQGAFKTAHDEGRQMLVMFSTEWCPQCEYIKERIFTDPDVAVRMKRFFLVGIDGDKSENQPAMDKFSIVGFPTFIILDPDGKEVTRFNDMGSASEFMAILSEAEGKNPEVIELGKASALEIEGKLSEAAVIYKGVYDRPKDSGSPYLEDALRGLLNTADGDTKNIKLYAKELIEKFSSSPHAPEYYKEYAKGFSSQQIKKIWLKKAAGIINERLANLKGLDAKTARLTTDEHVDILAGILIDEGDYDGMREAYIKGAKALETQVGEAGGVAANRHAISPVAYYYRKAGLPGRAVEFLGGAEKALPDYWPVYSSLAKSYLDMGDSDSAIENAKRGFELATEVARSKLALLWAEGYSAKGDYSEAARVIRGAIDDLKKSGTSESGRAARMMKELHQALAEYEESSGFVK